MAALKNILKGIFFIILLSLFLLITIEITVRLFVPKLFLTGIDKSYFEDKKFGSTFGFRSRLKGSIFEKRFITDDFGFRIDPSLFSLQKHKPSILLLGDSLSFGCGVEADSTFPSLLQRKIPNYRIINASIPGYSINDYYNLLEYFSTHLDFNSVIINICLNDFDLTSQTFIQEHFSKPKRTRELVPNILLRYLIYFNNRFFDFNNFFRRYSKAYALAKNLSFDASKLIYAADEKTYLEPDIRNTVSTGLLRINNLAKKNNKRIIFFILPYEFQLRAHSGKGCLLPQEIIAEVASKNSLDVIDLFPYLYTGISAEGKDSRFAYLLYDAMHFSEFGHRIVADAIFSELSRRKLIE